MGLVEIIAILITLAAGFSYLNHRFIKLPETIGLFLCALLFSLLLIGLDGVGLGISSKAEELLRQVDFNRTLLHGMLSFLLFAGALHINLDDLARRKWIIALLATAGVIGSTFLVGLLTHWVSRWLGLDLPLIFCLLFGALISPTDPVAVLSILKSAEVSDELSTIISGESLFNDGVALVVFLVLLEVSQGGHEISVMTIGGLFLKEALGGIVFGLITGGITYRLLKTVDHYQVEILLTLALVSGGFVLAGALHISGPLAVVVAGLLIGNHGRLLAMSVNTREHLDTFWKLVDDILNAVLFMLIGLEILLFNFEAPYLLAALVLIPLLLGVRWLSVGIPVVALSRFRDFTSGIIPIITWGGLRGGISVALALSLPPGRSREAILAITYCVVIFSILVQGLTIRRVARGYRSDAGTSSVS
jgi:CPA1 family monovalent cation:H+ antiporter